MHLIILGVIIISLVYGPQLWARYIFRKYHKPQKHFPGTGGELARHLLNEFNLQTVKLEMTEKGDHYDPETQSVRLSPQYFNGKSLTSVAIAAHEVGHAIQHAQNHPMLTLRTKLVRTAQVAEKAGSFAIIAIPVVTLITHAPAAGMLMFLIAIGSMLVSTVVHLVTLPVEWDASFAKALPVLKSGKYINQHEIAATKKILQAAALTYVAGSLASLLNLWRWLTILRRR
ncbi:MAG TPA: zinc metallopeptidase [Gammaproteobacteria bacterium]|nr:zinc metallopeptidase [Gammaproteobacteria bacterium]